MQITLTFSPAPREVLELHLHLPEGCTAHGALEQAGWLKAYPDLGTPTLTATTPRSDLSFNSLTRVPENIGRLTLLEQL